MVDGGFVSPLLFSEYMTGAPVSGDLDGDGRDEIAARIPNPEKGPERIRVLGLRDGEPVEVEQAARLRRPPQAPTMGSAEWPSHLFKLGCHEAAIEAYERALSTAEPASKSRLHDHIATCYLDLGRLEEAAASYAEAAATGTGDEVTRALFRRADIMTRIQRWGETARIIDQLDGLFLRDPEYRQLASLRAVVQSAREAGRDHPLLAASAPSALLVENPLAYTVSENRITTRSEATGSPRLAIPLHYHRDKFEIHFDLLPLRGDWQTYLLLSLRDDAFTTEGEEYVAWPETYKSRLWLRFSADGETTCPRRWLVGGGREVTGDEIPDCLKPAGEFRWELNEPLHVKITHLPASRKLRFELSNAAGEVVKRNWYELPGDLAPGKTLWLQCGMGPFTGDFAGFRSEFVVSNPEVRAKLTKPATLRPATTRDRLARGNGYFAQGEYALALEDYDQVLARLDQDGTLGGEREADCRLWRGLALERTEPGTGLEDFFRAFELAPAESVRRIRTGWTGMRERERDLAARVVQEEILAGETSLSWELLARLGIEPKGGASDENSLRNALLSAIGAEVSGRLLAVPLGLEDYLAALTQREDLLRLVASGDCGLAASTFRQADEAEDTRRALALFWAGASLLSDCTNPTHEHRSDLFDVLERCLILDDEHPVFHQDLRGARASRMRALARIAFRNDAMAEAVELTARMSELRPLSPAMELDLEVLLDLVAPD